MTKPTGPLWRVTPQAVLGLVAVGAGLLLTADNLALWETSRIVRFWPVGVILVGLVQVLQSDSRSGRVLGGAIMFVGSVWTADWVFGVNVSLEDFWPVILIVIGLMVLTRTRAPKATTAAPPPVPSSAHHIGPETAGFGWTATQSETPTAPAGAPVSGPTAATSEQTVSEVAVWAGKQRRLTTPSFRRADLVAIMGGVELDLRAATTATGEAVVEVFVMWGGVEIWVPPDWSVSNEVALIMAGAEDKSTGTQSARNRLIVRGFVLMGGIEIKT